MAYTSLYRQYRPNTFDAMIGQQHIIRTLKNTILSGSISHAYLFTGSRGTGKTSTAKIFARAINCISPLDDGSPCGKCAVCKQLEDQNSMDILEIDAASNNGVDEIRDLREKIKFPPVYGKYKVYIIDEVHMLSMAAFNALLKTLEEPPQHAVFILATTEVHKIPQTILSRCMRFDFRLLSTQELSDHLANIFKDINKPVEKEALREIAEAGDGSVRDMLSIADMCLSYSKEKITYDDVLEVLGACSPEMLIELVSYIVEENIPSALQLAGKMTSLGKSVELLSKDIAKTFRNIMYAKNCQNANKILCLPNDIYNKIAYLAKLANNDKLLRCTEIFVNLEASLRYTSSPKVIIEMAIVKACNVTVGLDTDSVILRLKEMEARVRELGQQVGLEKLVLSTENVWGYLLNVLQFQKSMSAAYTQASHVELSQLKIENGVLNIKVSKEGDASMLKYYLNDYENILKKRFFDLSKIQIVTDVTRDEMTKGIEELGELFGKENIKIIDTKTEKE
ncbi:MAG: DNA polymerase III subunit gamma/tau [Clostridia bacterium]